MWSEPALSLYFSACVTGALAFACPTVVEQTKSGRLHMGWFSGSAEGHAGVSIVYSSLNASSGGAGSAFGNATTLSQRPGYSNQNAVLYADDKASTLHVFHSQQQAGMGESAATVWHLHASLDETGRATNFSVSSPAETACLATTP